MAEVEEEVPEPVEPPERVNAALMLSFGPVHPSREALAVESFRDVSRHLGLVLAEGRISAFKPYLFADGQMGDTIGFFLIEASDRRDLFDLRRDPEFERLLARAAAATQNIRLNTMHAGAAAGRQVNLYRKVREDLGFIDPDSVS